MYRPRQAVLQQWKRSLQVGDVVDAQDKQGNWYEATVISSVHPSRPSNQTNDDTKLTTTNSAGGSNNVNNNNNNDDANKLGLPRVGVHFKGWGTEFDEEISPLDVQGKIQVRCLSIYNLWIFSPT